MQCSIFNVLRTLLTQEVTETLVLGTVMSHLDYCNGTLAGPLDVDISRMQCVQNIATKMVVLNDTSMKDSNSKNILPKLHWLPICRRIQYKSLTLIHKCLSCKAPEYLMKLLIQYPYTERRQELRSQNQKKKTCRTKNKAKNLCSPIFQVCGSKMVEQSP